MCATSCLITERDESGCRCGVWWGRSGGRSSDDLVGGDRIATFGASMRGKAVNVVAAVGAMTRGAGSLPHRDGGPDAEGGTRRVPEDAEGDPTVRADGESRLRGREVQPVLRGAE